MARAIKFLGKLENLEFDFNSILHILVNRPSVPLVHEGLSPYDLQTETQKKNVFRDRFRGDWFRATIYVSGVERVDFANIIIAKRNTRNKHAYLLSYPIQHSGGRTGRHCVYIEKNENQTFYCKNSYGSRKANPEKEHSVDGLIVYKISADFSRLANSRDEVVLDDGKEEEEEEDSDEDSAEDQDMKNLEKQLEEKRINNSC